MSMVDTTKTEECRIHGTPSRAANRALLIMISASLFLIIWHVWVYGPTAQTADTGSLQRPFPLLLGSEIWDLLFGSHGFVAELWDIFPYFIAGIFLAGYIRTYKIAVKLQATLKRHGILSVFLASLIGMITPLCACGTLTTAVSLLFARFPLAPVMALLVTSPLLSPSTYLLTLNDLGPEWTVIRTFAAFSMGMFAGVLTHLLSNRWFRSESIFIEGAIPRGDFHDEAYPDERFRCNCKERFGHRVAARTKNMFVVFLAKSSEMIWMVGKYVLVGVAIGTIVERYMPREWIYKLFGRKDGLSILWVTLGSVPVFLHQISASSILHHIKSTLDGTLDAGAGLAFMIGGPVTAMPTMIMFWTIFRKKVFFLYMSVCIVGTIIISYAFQFLVFVPYADTGNPLLKNVGSISGGESAVIKKKSRHARIVMDPGGNGMIATYNNAIEGRGGIVFDSNLQRFLESSAEKYDNRKYIANVAEWLRENNGLTDGKNILIYNTSPGSSPGEEALGSAARTELERKGFVVTVTDRKKMPEITEQALGQYSQLWVLFGGSRPGSYFSAIELKAISQFTRDGKGMLIAAGNHQGEAGGLTDANQISAGYGVEFSGFVENGDEVAVSIASRSLNRVSEALGRILKFVHKA